MGNNKNSMQPLLLQSVDWLEEELLLGIINSNETPSTVASSTKIVTNKSTNHSSLVSCILTGETVGCDDDMPNPTTRFSEGRDQSMAELPSSNASKADVTSATAVRHSLSISAEDSTAPKVEQELNLENTRAEQKSTSKRAEEKEEGADKQNSGEKEEGLLFSSKPESKQEPAPESAEKENNVYEEELTPITNGLPLTTAADKSSSPSGVTNEAEEGKEPPPSPSTHLLKAGPIDHDTPAIIGLPDKIDNVSDFSSPVEDTATSCNNSYGFYECDDF